MTFPEFAEYQQRLFDSCARMEDTKGIEYANGEDRFSNFNEEANDVGVERLKVAEIFLNKHIRAIKSYIKYGHSHSEEHIQGRIVDAITYLSLIGGMIYEDQNSPTMNIAKEKVNDALRSMQKDARQTESPYTGGLGRQRNPNVRL